MVSIPEFSLPATNRRVLLSRRPIGVPGAGDFIIDTAPRPEPEDGELLVRNLYLSVDPAQRGWASDVSNYAEPVPLDAPMRALAVGKVIESRVPGRPAGGFVYGWLGWQDYAVVTPDAILSWIDAPAVPLSAYAGPLGINGLTAALAFDRLGRPLEDDVVMVSTAAGAVGSIVGQLARAAGCRTIGLAGGTDKVVRCTARYGYDAAINYKAKDVAAAIARVAPDGIDIFFDNVGGETLDMVLRRMRTGGRIIQCGTAATASWSPPPFGPRAEREVLTRRLSWGGFVIFDHLGAFGETIAALTAKIIASDLVYDEDIDEGIEHAPGALARLYAGENRGKKLIFVG